MEYQSLLVVTFEIHLGNVTVMNLDSGPPSKEHDRSDGDQYLRAQVKSIGDELHDFNRRTSNGLSGSASPRITPPSTAAPIRIARGMWLISNGEQGQLHHSCHLDALTSRAAIGLERE